MAGIPTLIVNVVHFNNTVNLSNKNKTKLLFGYSILTSRLSYGKAFHNVVSLGVVV